MLNLRKTGSNSRIFLWFIRHVSACNCTARASAAAPPSRTFMISSLIAKRPHSDGSSLVCPHGILFAASLRCTADCSCFSSGEGPLGWPASSRPLRTNLRSHDPAPPRQRTDSQHWGLLDRDGPTPQWLHRLQLHSWERLYRWEKNRERCM